MDNLDLRKIPIIKIDHLESKKDVTICRDMGVNYLGISVSDSSIVRQIIQIIDNDFSDICLRFDLSDISEEECIEVCRCYQPRGVDFIGHFLPTKATCRTLLSEQFQVFFSNIEASYDTDPSWILGRYHDDDLLGLKNTYFQIDLVEEFEDAWTILRDVVSENCDELTISDINEISQKHNLILNINFRMNNIAEIIQTLPSISGVVFSLDQNGLCRSYTTRQVEDILRTQQWIE